MPQFAAALTSNHVGAPSAAASAAVRIGQAVLSTSATASVSSFLHRRNTSAVALKNNDRSTTPAPISPDTTEGQLVVVGGTLISDATETAIDDEATFAA